VEAAVAVEVADGDSPRGAGIVGEARRAQVEEGAMPVVQQDLVPQRIRPLAEPAERPQVAGAEVEVLPAVEVEVGELDAPREAVLAGRLAGARHPGLSSSEEP